MEPANAKVTKVNSNTSRITYSTHENGKLSGTSASVAHGNTVVFKAMMGGTHVGNESVKGDGPIKIISQKLTGNGTTYDVLFEETNRANSESSCTIL